MADTNTSPSHLPEPKLSKLLFSDTRLSFIWVIIRVYVGWTWLSSGIEKVQNPVWAGEKAGAHPAVQGWYASFLKDVVLPNAAVFSYAVSYGELLVGIGLILGAFVGIAAFFGAFMNMNFLLAGTVSTNPILFVLELSLILAWRVAGWWGADRFLLPLLGVPWKPGKLFKKAKS